MGTTARTARHRAAGLALVLTAGLALAGCSGVGGTTSSGSGTTGNSKSSAPSTNTSTSSGTSSPPGSAATSTGSASPGSGAGSSGAGPAGATRCTAATTRTRAVTDPGGGAAGSFGVELVTTNTGRAACTLEGFPGVSLTAPGSGAQLGAAADREPEEASPSVRLAPGASATALVRVTQAANYGSRCTQVTAAGFRVYLPGQTAAQYAPYHVEACSEPDVHLLSVRPFHT